MAVRPYQGLRQTPLSVHAAGDQWILNGDSALVSAAPANGFLVTATLQGRGQWRLLRCHRRNHRGGYQRSTSAELAGHIHFNNVAISAENTPAINGRATELLEWQVTAHLYRQLCRAAGRHSG